MRFKLLTSRIRSNRLGNGATKTARIKNILPCNVSTFIIFNSAKSKMKIAIGEASTYIKNFLGLKNCQEQQLSYTATLKSLKS